jgi:basic membrane protein A
MKICRTLVLFTIFALSLAACNPPATNVDETPTALPEPTVVSAKPFRVAVIMPSSVNDLAFSQSMYDALNRLQKDMGGAEKMQYVYSQGMFIVEDAAAAIRTYASQGYDLVIAHGSQYGQAIKDIAPEFPAVSFVWTNATSPVNLPNVFEVVATAQEGGYVNGVLAATLTTNKIISIIGPVETGEPKQYIDGFKAGVISINPEIQLNVTYIGSFSDVVKASDAATNDISAGADVMTGTSQMVVGPIGKANQNTILWFGTQSNQSSLAPKIVVANQVYHWEVALKEVVTKVQTGTLGGESFTINLSNGGEVIEYNPAYALPANAKALGDATIQGIIDGTIKISLP